MAKRQARKISIKEKGSEDPVSDFLLKNLCLSSIKICTRATQKHLYGFLPSGSLGLSQEDSCKLRKPVKHQGTTI